MKKASYKLHLKKDDIVQVISGKEKGKKGKGKEREEERERGEREGGGGGGDRSKEEHGSVWGGFGR